MVLNIFFVKMAVISLLFENRPTAFFDFVIVMEKSCRIVLIRSLIKSSSAERGKCFQVKIAAVVVWNRAIYSYHSNIVPIHPVVSFSWLRKHSSFWLWIFNSRSKSLKAVCVWRRNCGAIAFIASWNFSTTYSGLYSFICRTKSNCAVFVADDRH